MNKLANIAPEVNETAKLNEGALQQFIPGDRMYYDRKGIDAVHAKSTARLIVATNNRPPIGDRSDGMWRRLLYVPFLVQIAPDRQDRQLAQKLRRAFAGHFELGA